MKQQVKDDWIINNQNIFGLQPDIALSLSCIQYEIHNQIEEKSIKSISDYLGAEIDISKEIRLTKKLTIKKILVDFLGFESFNTLNQNTFSCRMILCYLQLSLLKEYIENKHKNILTFAEYKTHYSSMLNSFLTSNIDTDEQDFIEAELTLCNNLLTELNKPVYSELGILNNILDKPCEFKKNLTNSVDKRVKFIDELSKLKALPPQPIVKQKPELNGKLITFKNNETIEKIHSELKGYFPNKEAELLKALQGEQLSEILLFPHNQNKFVEVFRRLKYNGFLLNTDTEIKNWICTTFQFVKKGFAEPQPFNESSVWDILNKGKGEPTKKERINIQWLPYKSPLQLKRETENEKL